LGYEKISQEPDTEIARTWIREHKIASIPVSVFYRDNSDHHLLRFCFAKEDATLEQAAALLQAISDRT
jgi:methionine aminotransferase